LQDQLFLCNLNPPPPKKKKMKRKEGEIRSKYMAESIKKIK